MRRAFIAFGIVAFLVYCWGSVAYQNRVGVPDYRLVDVDLLGGKTRAAWDADPQGQFQQLMDLETKAYQLPVDAVVKAGKPGEDAADSGHVHADGKGNIPVDRALTSDDFAWIISSAPPGERVVMKLRDTSAIYGLLGHNYLLRDSIADPGNPDGQPLFTGGAPLDKAMLDRMRAYDIKFITVTGHAEPVNYLFGTSIMVAIIFMTLVAALKPILWDPFLAMLEKRRHELEIGGEAERQNQIEATRFEDEKRRRTMELDRKIQAHRLNEQRETAVQAGQIVREAREKEKAVKLAGLREMGKAAEEAGFTLERKVPELAQEIADALTPGRGGPRWDIMTKGGGPDADQSPEEE